MEKGRGGGAKSPEVSQPYESAPAPGSQGHAPEGELAAGLLVLVHDARPEVCGALAAGVARLLPAALIARRGEAHALPAHAQGQPPQGGGGRRVLVLFQAAPSAEVPPGWEAATPVIVRPAPSAAAGDGASFRSGPPELGDVAYSLALCGLLRCGGDVTGAALVAEVPIMVRSLLPGVHATAAVLAARANAALQIRNYAELARAGHTMMGMAASYALRDVAACAFALERAAREENAGAAGDALAWIVRAVDALGHVVGADALA